MTIVGKILVFVNLVFSLAVGGLVVVVFATRANWKDAYDKEHARYEAANADRDQAFTEKLTAKEAFDKSKQVLEADLATAVKARTAAEKEMATITAERNQFKQQAQAGTAGVLAVQTSAGVRMMQVKELNAYLESEREDKRKVIAQKNAERQLRIRAEVDSKTYKALNGKLEDEIRSLAKELARSKLGASTATVARKRGEDNPPAENINGKILTIDAASDLVRISVGSDAGLATGHTLKVFRFDAVPENSKFLGTLEILSVRPHEAVGRPVRRPAFPLRPGDRVAARIQVGG